MKITSIIHKFTKKLEKNKIYENAIGQTSIRFSKYKPLEDNKETFEKVNVLIIEDRLEQIYNLLEDKIYKKILENYDTMIEKVLIEKYCSEEAKEMIIFIYCAKGTNEDIKRKIVNIGIDKFIKEEEIIKIIEEINPTKEMEAKSSTTTNTRRDYSTHQKLEATRETYNETNK